MTRPEPPEMRPLTGKEWKVASLWVLTTIGVFLFGRIVQSNLFQRMFQDLWK